MLAIHLSFEQIPKYSFLPSYVIAITGTNLTKWVYLNQSSGRILMPFTMTVYSCLSVAFRRAVDSLQQTPSRSNRTL